MIALDVLEELEQKWNDSTITERERERLVVLSGAIR